MHNPKSNSLNQTEATSRQVVAAVIPDMASCTRFRNGGSQMTSIVVNPLTPASHANAVHSYVQMIELLAVPAAAHLMQQAELTQSPGRAGREYKDYRKRSPGVGEEGPVERLHYWELVRHVDVDESDWVTTRVYILTEHGKIGSIDQANAGEYRLMHAIDMRHEPSVVLERLLMCLAYVVPRSA